MVVLWPYMKQVVSRCPGWHSKAKLVSEACKFDHKSDEVPLACTAEVDMKNEPREDVGSVDDACEISDWKN